MGSIIHTAWLRSLVCFQAGPNYVQRFPIDPVFNHKPLSSSQICTLFNVAKSCSATDPGRPPKNDKASILNDGVNVVKKLRDDIAKLQSEHALLMDESKEVSTEENALQPDCVRAPRLFKTLGAGSACEGKAQQRAKYGYDGWQRGPQR